MRHFLWFLGEFFTTSVTPITFGFGYSFEHQSNKKRRAPEGNVLPEGGDEHEIPGSNEVNRQLPAHFLLAEVGQPTAVSGGPL